MWLIISYFHDRLWYVRPSVHDMIGPPVMDLFHQDKLPSWASIPMKAITFCYFTKRVILISDELGDGWIAVRYIGVQICTHNIVMEVHINPVLLLLCIYNHYRQQSTLALFISWLEIPIVMMHGAFGEWRIKSFLLYIFFLVRPCLYMLRRAHLPCGK